MQKLQCTGIASHKLNKQFHIKQGDIVGTPGFKKRPKQGEVFRVMSGSMNGALFDHEGGEGAVDKDKVELWSEKYRDFSSYQRQVKGQIFMGQECGRERKKGVTANLARTV